MTRSTSNAAAIALVLAALVAAWLVFLRENLPPGFARANGRLEAVEIDVATKQASRVASILVAEGDFVVAGQELARMDCAVLKAELREAEANLARARIGVETAGSLVRQREAERDAARAIIAQRDAELENLRKTTHRAETLVAREAAPVQRLDDMKAALAGGEAALSAGEAGLAAADAPLGSARSGVIAAEAGVDAVAASIEPMRPTSRTPSSPRRAPGGCSTSSRGKARSSPPAGRSSASSTSRTST